MTENGIAQIVHEKCLKIQQTLGVGLLEKAYQQVLVYELRKEGLKVETEVELPINYEQLTINNAYRVDLLVEDKVIIEIKAIDKLLPIHRSQVLTYLRMSGKKLGLLMNFGDSNYSENYKRILNCASPDELERE